MCVTLSPLTSKHVAVYSMPRCFYVVFLGKVLHENSALLVRLFVVTPSLPRNGGTARTEIQVHAVNLIEIRLGERWQPISNQS